MKIIEAIKELPLIIKKMETTNRKVQEFSSALTTEVDNLPFGSVKEQKAEMVKLLQSNVDLRHRYLDITRKLAYTNTQVQMTVEGMTMSITEWLAFRGVARQPELFRATMDTLKALNTKTAEIRLRGSQQVDLTQQTLGIIRMFDQATVEEAKEELDNIFGLIDGKLEVVNATTDLLDPKGL